MSLFGVSVSQTTGTTINGVGPIYQMTDAVRSSTTFPNNSICWTTDTNLWYLGDGQTVGGISNELAFTRTQLETLGIIKPRHVNVFPTIRKILHSGLTSDIPTLFSMGNSIMMGTLVSTPANYQMAVCAAKMATFVGYGTTGNWTPTNLAVTGSSIEDSEITCGDSSDANPFNIKQGKVYTSNNGWTFLFPLKNEGGSSYNLIQRKLTPLCNSLRKKNYDAFFMIDSPTIDGNGNVATTDNTTLLNSQRLAMAAMAGDYGFTLINVFAYFQLINQLGINLNPFYAYPGTGTINTVHPSDRGHAEMGNLAFYAVTSPSNRAARFYNSVPETPLLIGQRVQVSNQWIMGTSTATLTNWNVSPFVAPRTPTTLRAYQNGDATPQVYVATTGQSGYFMPPAPFSALLINSYATPSNSGGITVYAYSSLSISADTGSDQPITRLLDINSSSSALVNRYPPVPGTNNMGNTYSNVIKVSATGSQACWGGVGFVHPNIIEQHSKYPNSVEVGTWADSTLTHALVSYSETGRGSSTVGDTLTVKWWGTDLHVWCQNGTNIGKFSSNTDAAGATTYDLYNTVGDITPVTLAFNLAEGWHSTVLTIVTKNASSSGNLVNFSHWITVDSTPDPSQIWVSIGSGETMQLTGVWRYVEITSTISGTPVLSFVPFASTISCSGGAAVIKLSK